MVKFCPKCNNLMLPKGELLACTVCGYSEKPEEMESYELKEKLEVKEEIVVIEQKEDLPTTRIECKSCGHMEVFWWLQQTRCADEPETRFYKCTKCGHTWREYD